MEADARIFRLGVKNEILVFRLTHLHKQRLRNHFQNAAQDGRLVVELLIGVPFAPSAEETGLDHMDDIDVLLEQRAKLLHVRQHDLVAGFAAAGHTPLVSKADVELDT